MLRGINVGKNHLLAMEDLKKCLEELGYKNATTYIRSGNAVMTGSAEPTEIVAQKIEKKLTDFAGFSIPVVVYTGKEFLEMVEKNPMTTQLGVLENSIVVAYRQQSIRERKQYTLKSLNEEGIPFKKAVFIKITGPQSDSFLLKEYQKQFKKESWTIRNWKTTLKIVDLVHFLNKGK